MAFCRLSNAVHFCIIILRSSKLSLTIHMERRSQRLLNHSRNSPSFMQAKTSLPFPQDPGTSHPGLDEYQSILFHLYYFNIHFDSNLPSKIRFFGISHQSVCAYYQSLSGDKGFIYTLHCLWKTLCDKLNKLIYYNVINIWSCHFYGFVSFEHTVAYRPDAMQRPLQTRARWHYTIRDSGRCSL